MAELIFQLKELFLDFQKAQSICDHQRAAELLVSIDNLLYEMELETHG